MVLMFSVFALGRVRVGCSRGSTTTQLIPRSPSSTAADRPTGPPPAISTCVERDGVLPGAPR
jgi:hypothetical protein